MSSRRSIAVVLLLGGLAGGAWGSGLSNGMVANNVDTSPLMKRPTVRKTSYCWASGSATTFTCSAEAAMGVAGTASNQPELSPYMVMLRHQTAATTDSVGGLNANTTAMAFRQQWRPKVTVNIFTDTALTNRRTWYGIVPSVSVSTLTHATGPTAAGAGFVALGYDTSISSAWRCCTGDKVNYTCADIPGSTVVAETDYTLVADYSIAGQATCSVTVYATGVTTSLTKTNNLVTDTALWLHAFAVTVTLANEAKNQNTSVVAVERN
jgi:hypothetical protein